MALKCRCLCGCKLLVSSDSAGKRIKCPKCERKLRVPVDLVERRRAQREARKGDPQTTPPRSKIEKPLSSLVDLPEPEPPPVQLGPDQPITVPSQADAPNEPHVATPVKASPPEASPPEASPPEATAGATVSQAVPPPKPLSQATRTPSASPRGEPHDESNTSRKPPPLPKRNKDRAIPRREPGEREEPSAPVADKAAASTFPAEGAPVAESDPTTTDDVREVPQLESDDVELPVRGYQADRDKVATVRWLAAAILLTGLVGTVPAIIDVVEHALSETSEGLSRWACGLLLVGLLQCAYAVYLVQLPDWSSVWVVTIFTLAIAASYAAMFGLTLLSSDQGHFVQVLDLADRLRGGKATAWCLIMLSLMSLTSYFSGRVGARWRSVFVA